MCIWLSEGPYSELILFFTLYNIPIRIKSFGLDSYDFVGLAFNCLDVMSYLREKRTFCFALEMIELELMFQHGMYFCFSNNILIYFEISK